MNLYRRAIRPVLFRLDAERAHEVGKTVLRRPVPWRLLGRSVDPGDSRLRTTIAGIEFRNPVGLAAGFDKNSEMLDAFQRLGFGYAIPGSIRGRPAEARPPVFRRKCRQCAARRKSFPRSSPPARSP